MRPDNSLPLFREHIPLNLRPIRRMKRTLIFLVGCFIAVAAPTTGLTLTMDLPVTPDYVREHSKEWSVKVTKGKEGLIQFTIVRTVAKPKYLVAHLAIEQEGKTIAETSTPPVYQKPRQQLSFFRRAAEHGGLQFRT